jgi:hypothetical protein
LHDETAAAGGSVCAIFAVAVRRQCMTAQALYELLAAAADPNLLVTVASKPVLLLLLSVVCSHCLF